MLPVYQLLKFLSLYNMTIYYNDNTFYVHSKSPKKICKWIPCFVKLKKIFQSLETDYLTRFLTHFISIFKVHMDSFSLIFYIICKHCLCTILCIILFCINVEAYYMAIPYFTCHPGGPWTKGYGPLIRLKS